MWRRSVAATVLIVAVAALAQAPASAQTPRSRSPARWLQSVPELRFVNVLLVGGFTEELGGFNFNGFGRGKLTITVPLGWTVNVVFINHHALPHSAMVTAWRVSRNGRKLKPAFAGARTPLPYTGARKGRLVSFRFTASKPGKYRLACAVPGHLTAGMWDILIVKRGIDEATAGV